MVGSVQAGGDCRLFYRDRVIHSLLRHGKHARLEKSWAQRRHCRWRMENLGIVVVE